MDINNILEKSRKASIRSNMIADKFYAYIKNSISECEYDFWFRNLDIVMVTKNHIIFEVQTSLTKEWIVEYYYDLLVEALNDVVDTESTFQIIVLDEASLLNQKIDSLECRMTVIEEKIGSKDYLKQNYFSQQVQINQVRLQVQVWLKERDND